MILAEKIIYLFTLTQIENDILMYLRLEFEVFI